MFISVETKGATHLFIEVPVESAATALPTLLNLFERSAVFVRKGYRDVATVTPAITVTLGDAVVVDGEVCMNVLPSGCAVTEGFELPTPTVVANFTNLVRSLQSDVSRLVGEVSYLKGQIAERDRLINEMRDAAGVGQPVSDD